MPGWEATASKSLANVLADHGYTREHFADVADAAQLPLELYYYCRELLRDDTRRLTRTRPAGPTGARRADNEVRARSAKPMRSGSGAGGGDRRRS